METVITCMDIYHTGGVLFVLLSHRLIQSIFYCNIRNMNMLPRITWSSTLKHIFLQQSKHGPGQVQQSSHMLIQTSHDHLSWNFDHHAWLSCSTINIVDHRVSGRGSSSWTGTRQPSEIDSLDASCGFVHRGSVRTMDLKTQNEKTMENYYPLDGLNCMVISLSSSPDPWRKHIITIWGWGLGGIVMVPQHYMPDSSPWPLRDPYFLPFRMGGLGASWWFLTVWSWWRWCRWCWWSLCVQADDGVRPWQYFF